MNDPTGWPYSYLSQALPLAPLHPFIRHLHDGKFPELTELNALLAKLEPEIRLRSGQPLRLAPQARGRLPFDLQYEPRCYLKGEVQTREHNWHDLFNALVWMRFPGAKAAINARHYAVLGEASESPDKGRGSTRDVATLLDESGVIVACAAPELEQLLRDFRWKDLFWKQRADLAGKIDFCVFGHGLYEKLLTPYLGLTGQGLILEVPPAYFAQSPDERAVWLDELLAAYLDNPRHCLSTRELTPVPLLGIPGWDAANADPAYYDNTKYFRSGRGGPARAPGKAPAEIDSARDF